MAQLQQFKTILREQLKSDKVPDWFDQILYLINNTLKSMWDATNGNLSLGQNIASKTQTFQVPTASDYTTAFTFTPITVTWSFFQRVTKVEITHINENTDRYTIFHGAATCDWQQIDSQTVRINYISGLENSKTYNCTVLLV